MTEPWYRRLSDGLSKSREQLEGQINVLLNRGPDVDDEFWDDLEDALIASDMGVTAVTEIVDRLRDDAKRQALPDAVAVLDHLADAARRRVPRCRGPPGRDAPDGAGRRRERHRQDDDGRQAGQAGSRMPAARFSSAHRTRTAPQLSSSSTCGPSVPVSRSSSVSAAPIRPLSPSTRSPGRGRCGVDLTLIDTAGRLHTSPDLMAELKKVTRVTENQSAAPGRTLLVMDATTGQNGLAQAREFDAALGLDGIVLTKLDGTAKGGIVVAVARELQLPIVRIGVGESIDDLRPFDAEEFSRALLPGRVMDDRAGAVRHDEVRPYSHGLSIPLVAILVVVIIGLYVLYTTALVDGDVDVPHARQW